MKIRFVAASLLAALLAASVASASSIGVFFAADGSDCDAQQATLTTLDIYVLAILAGDPAAGGITGAEFQLTGLPNSWFNSATMSPSAAVSIGNPITGGCTVGFPSCQPGPMVLLYTVSSFATDAQSNLTYRIEKHSNPNNPFFDCPLVVICDAPVYTKACVSGGTAFVNGGACTVGVAAKTWSQVKAFYE